MRIAIDARELAGRPTGVGRFLGEILREWAHMPEAAVHEFVFCAPTEIAEGAGSKDPASVQNTADVQNPAHAGLRAQVEIEAGGGTSWEQRVLPRLAERAGADVLFCPGYSGPIFGKTPTVVAIHDVSFAAHPEWFRWREGLRRRVVTRHAARRAVRVITVSEFSRREIVDHLGIPASKIDVVYHGATRLHAGVDGGGARYVLPPHEPLILYVGSIFNRRHVPETIRGFARLARRRPDTRLAIVGDNRTFPAVDLRHVISDTQQDDRVQVSEYVSDEALGDLYHRARAFVFLSEYEGFGLTPLEALASGIPIVVLDTPVAREVYGEAAIYIAAPDPHLIETAIEQALFDENVRARVLREAPAVVSRYTWTDSARRVLRILESAR